MPKKGDIRTIDEFADEKFGEVGTEGRDSVEQGFEEFKLGFMIQEARKKKGMKMCIRDRPESD